MLKLFQIIFWMILLAGYTYAKSCEMEIVGSSPLFSKDFGSKTIVFKAKGDRVLFQDGEKISAFCNDEMEIKDYNNNNFVTAGRTTEFSCRETVIEVENQLYHYGVKVSCGSTKTLRLYETNRKLPKCNAFMSYAIGAKLSSVVDDVIKAAICYDFERFELKFATYISELNRVTISNKLNVGNKLFINLERKVSDFRNYIDFVDASSPVNLNQLTKMTVHSDEFQYESLIQNEQLKTELEEYSYIFNTLWWRQLRQENWRYFQDALREHSHSTKYLIYTGTYGNITVPTVSNCSSPQNEVLSVRTDDVVVQAPAYIWAYLQSLTPEDTEAFVVIGHNSPYANNPDHSKFCKVDICDEIGWLKESKFGYLRRLTTFGYTFCCRPEDVAMVIDYFRLEKAVGKVIDYLPSKEYVFEESTEMLETQTSYSVDDFYEERKK